MDSLLDMPIRFADGQSGRVVSMQADATMGAVAVVRLGDGREVSVATSALRSDGRGGYVLPIDTQTEYVPVHSAAESVLSIPVIEEELHIGKQTVETGRARITKRVIERDEVIDDPLMHEEVAIERFEINRPIDGSPPAVRYEGDRMIVPLLAEEYVVTKRLILKEELHIYRVRHEVSQPQTVTLRREEVSVERIEPQAGQTSDAAYDLT
jgi:uncharacterized protein (TIGR02271 family)